MAHAVAKIVVPTISAGLLEPATTLIPMIVAGIKVMQPVFRAKKVHIASVASLGFLLSFCNSCMAFKPNGVAAFPRPIIFALRFITMAPIAG